MILRKYIGKQEMCVWPYPQLPTLLADQLAVLDKVHGTLVHGIVGLVAKPVFIALEPETERRCV